MKKKNKKPKFQNVNINVDEKVITVGKYCDEEHLFKYNQNSEFDIVNGCWSLDEGVLNFLVSRNAVIELTDTRLKFKYKISASDFKYKGTVYKNEMERSSVKLKVSEWEITHIKNMPQVYRCYEEDCKYNFMNVCTRGVITINKEGECAGFEDRD